MSSVWWEKYFANDETQRVKMIRKLKKEISFCGVIIIPFHSQKPEHWQVTAIDLSQHTAKYYNPGSEEPLSDDIWQNRKDQVE